MDELINELAAAAHAPRFALSIDKRLIDPLPKWPVTLALALPPWRQVRRLALHELGIPEQMRAMASAIIPLGRPATPTEASGPVLFLASPLSNYVQGQTLNVTGGMFGGMYT